MKTMSVSVALLLLGSSAYAQFAADSPYCRLNPDAFGCPPPVRIQIVPPEPTTGTSPLVQSLLDTMSGRHVLDRQKEEDRRRHVREDSEQNREQQKLDQEERRLRLDEAREERLRGANPIVDEPAPLAPEVQAQLLAFAAACPDWGRYAPKMVEYGAKLRPGETDATEYLTLLYRLAKMDAK